jgi:Ca2+-dependent lipid-binding protein
MKYELNIHVIDAKDVPGMDLNGKSDLFVEVKVDQKFRKTKTIKKTSEPPFKFNKNRLSNLG